jgi:ketosteroid isomerase-like protein
MVDQVRRMVAGEGVAFAELFAEDGVLTYPFPAPGQPTQLLGREAIREYHSAASQRRELIQMDGLEVRVRETDDPEVVVAEIEHHGTSRVTGQPYRVRALGVIRVRDGKIVSYDDYLDPLAIARIFGRTEDVIAALQHV